MVNPPARAPREGCSESGRRNPMKIRRNTPYTGLALPLLTCGLLTVLGSGDTYAGKPNGPKAAPSRSTTIALTPNEDRVVVVNREANSLSVIRVKDKYGQDVAQKLFEIPV